MASSNSSSRKNNKNDDNPSYITISSSSSNSNSNSNKRKNTTNLELPNTSKGKNQNKKFCIPTKEDWFLNNPKNLFKDEWVKINDEEAYKAFPFKWERKNELYTTSKVIDPMPELEDLEELPNLNLPHVKDPQEVRVIQLLIKFIMEKKQYEINRQDLLVDIKLKHLFSFGEPIWKFPDLPLKCQLPNWIVKFISQEYEKVNIKVAGIATGALYVTIEHIKDCINHIKMLCIKYFGTEKAKELYSHAVFESQHRYLIPNLEISMKNLSSSSYQVPNSRKSMEEIIYKAFVQAITGNKSLNLEISHHHKNSSKNAPADKLKIKKTKVARVRPFPETFNKNK